MLKRLDKGRAWVKLSGAYQDTRTGPPTYADVSMVARAYVNASPERMVWGSDWPYPTEKTDTKPDDAILFDLLADWAPDEATRSRSWSTTRRRCTGSISRLIETSRPARFQSHMRVIAVTGRYISRRPAP